LVDSPAYDPKETRFWDPVDVLTEERRQFDVCHGCRLCWNLCPAFPALFDLTDSVDGEMEKLSKDNFAPVEDLCFQCKLCWVVCPYTAPHKYDMDIPTLLMRSKFQRAQEDGIPLAKKLISDQDRLAKLAGGIKSPLANLANSFSPSRRVIELAIGVHHDANLPTFARETFRDWFRKWYGEALKPQGAIKKAAFFASCTLNYNDPDIGKAALSVLEHNNVEVVVPDVQCCGMPLMDVGDFDGATKKMDHNLDRLAALVDDGYDIVVAQPTCALVLRDDYPRNSNQAEAAKRVAEHTFEFGHYVTNLAREKLLLRDFTHGLGKVGFHVACHTRRQSVGNNSARVLGIVPETEVTQTEGCSGHDGSWGISKQYFPLSLKVGKKLFDNLNKGAPDILVSDCPLAARHIEIGTGRRPIHTAQALAAAYGLSGAPLGVGRDLAESSKESTASERLKE
jgi:glycerol-3-phosphate dehydrogenase subunit C